MIEIENVLYKYNLEKRKETDFIFISDVENELNFTFPEDYKFFAQNYVENELFFGNEFFRLWDFNNLIEINKSYLITRYITNIIGIGTNGSAEYIIIELLENGEMHIVLATFIDLDKQYNIEIGTNFTDFFERLENGKNWFDTEV